MTERLSNKNPCNACKVDRQIGNPNRWECECSRCDKPNDWKNDCIKKLAEYETAEDEGRLVVLPCKIGQTVYKIIREPWGFWIGTSPFMFETRRDIGKTVFLTRKEAEKVIEEAEKALKGMEGK